LKFNGERGYELISEPLLDEKNVPVGEKITVYRTEQINVNSR